MSLKFDQVVERESLLTAASSVDAIHNFWTRYHNNADRYFCTIFLIGAIMPLSCMIVRSDPNVYRIEAVTSFRKALKVMEEIGEGFALARRMIERLQGVIDAAIRPIMLDHEISETVNLDATITSDGQGSAFGQHRAPLLSSNLGTPSMGEVSGMWDDFASLGMDFDSLLNYQMLVPMG